MALGLTIGIASSRADQMRTTDADAPASATVSDGRHNVLTTKGFPQRYEAIYHGDDGLEHAGVLSMAADGKLAIVSSDDRFVETLDIVVHSMNTMPHETIRVPPKPDRPRWSLHSPVISRSSAEFIPTMLANIRRGYRLELRPESTP
jgi:hypothetical protein